MSPTTYRVVVHNGNQDAENAVLGFADITIERVVAPREDVSTMTRAPTMWSRHSPQLLPRRTYCEARQAKAKEAAPKRCLDAPG